MSDRIDPALNGEGASDSSASSSNGSASEAPKGLWIRYGDYLFKYRNAIFPAVMAVILAAFQPTYPGGSALYDSLLDILGVVLVVAGLGVRVVVIGLAYIKRGGLKKRVYAKNLVTEGIFAHCRNPLYVGNLLILVGFFVVHNNPLVYLLGGGFFLSAYAAIVAAEEHFLRGKFGEAYGAYCRDVHRWWIGTRGLGQTFQGMTFNWRRVIIKDYSTIATTTVTLLLIFSYQMVIARGFEASRDLLVVLVITMVMTIIAALWVRVLKKSGALTEHSA